MELFYVRYPIFPNFSIPHLDAQIKDYSKYFAIIEKDYYLQNLYEFHYS